VIIKFLLNLLCSFVADFGARFYFVRAFLSFFHIGC
jgi:hypothetical protein